ncbi:MAG: hypothetical protein ACI9X8_002486, partial [Pseudoalteromonas distincta]
ALSKTSWQYATSSFVNSSGILTIMCALSHFHQIIKGR